MQTSSDIRAEEARLKSLPMGPHRWRKNAELRKAKARCVDYISPVQEITFSEWLIKLAVASRESAAGHWAEGARASYYEGNPESWVDYYDNGYGPADAIAEDCTYWD